VRLSNWHDKKLKPVFEDLRAKDSAQDASMKALDTSLQGYINARVNDALSKLNQLQNTVTGNMNTLYARMLPVGSVIMWGLTLDVLPSNFVICDGREVTINGKPYKVPNLINRFALGISAGGRRNWEDGEETVKLGMEHIPSHNHGGGSHLHGLRVGWGSKEMSHQGTWDTTGLPQGTFHPDDGVPAQAGTSGVGGRYSRENAILKAESIISYQGGGLKHNNMPPYCTVYYVIKIAN
jgi:microcystin-dependent protein